MIRHRRYPLERAQNGAAGRELVALCYASASTAVVMALKLTSVTDVLGHHQQCATCSRQCSDAPCSASGCGRSVGSRWRALAIPMISAA